MSTSIANQQAVWIRTVMALTLIVFFGGCSAESTTDESTQYVWKQGYLDIHHINTGRGNATFMIFPDGTTLLYDAGVVLKTGKEFANWKEHRADIHPNASRSPGAWIAHYIDSFMPPDRGSQLDYAVISHFHIDHFGEVDPELTPFAGHGGYQISGITEVGYRVPIAKILDRGCPDYNFPADLRTFYQRTGTVPGFLNYLKFIEYESEHAQLECEGVIAGSNTQIRLQRNPETYPTFSVRNLKVNDRYWSGVDDSTFTYEFPEPLFNQELDTFNENPLSIALKISYGSFDYVIAGDIAGVNGFPNFDMETTLGDVAGPVDVMTLNHHGANDSTNTHYLERMSPQIVVHQALHGHHYYKPVIERIHALGNTKALTMNADDKVREDIGSLFDDVFLNEEGHIVIRVFPDGSQFEAMVLDDNTASMPIVQRFGPYAAR